MGKDFYNNESEFSDVIGLLKSLPKINAPVNFEFNLQTRIQNGNFKLPPEKQFSRWLTWSLGPIAAVALSAIVFFFVISNSGFQTENLLMQKPELRRSTNIAKNSTAMKINNNVAESPSNKLKAIIEPNDVVIARKNNFPFNSGNSIDLDAYISGSKAAARYNSNIHTVSSGPASVDFYGFGIPVKTSPKQLAAMRQKIDSLRAANANK